MEEKKTRCVSHIAGKNLSPFLFSGDAGSDTCKDLYASVADYKLPHPCSSHNKRETNSDVLEGTLLRQIWMAVCGRTMNRWCTLERCTVPCRSLSALGGLWPLSVSSMSVETKTLSWWREYASTSYRVNDSESRDLVFPLRFLDFARNDICFRALSFPLA